MSTYRHALTGALLALGLALSAQPAAVPAAGAAEPPRNTTTDRTTAAPAAGPVSGPAAAPLAKGGQVAKTWAPTYMSPDHSYSRAEAEALARRFDLVAGMPVAFRDHVRAMRSANPALRLIAYANATLATPEDARGLPRGAFARDVRGRRIKAVGWGTYLMQPSSPAWRRAANRQCDERAALGGYDGCLVDMLTLGIFARNFVTALPVRPGTDRLYTEGQWRQQMAALAKVYRRRSPALVHVGNAVENSYRYWQSPVRSRPLATSMPATQMEDFMRGAHDPADDFPGLEDWRRDVRVVRDLEAHGVTGLFTTKVWSGASPAQLARWQAYAMSTFLLGANGNSYFAFTASRDKAGASGTNAPYRMPRGIGRPTGEMQRQESGAYVRRFANGLAVANPTNRAVTVQVERLHRSLGGQVSVRFTLPARSGDVLVAL